MTVRSPDRNNRTASPTPAETAQQAAPRVQEGAAATRAESSGQAIPADRDSFVLRQTEGSGVRLGDEAGAARQTLAIKEQRRAARSSDAPLIGSDTGAQANWVITRTLSPNLPIQDNKTITSTIEVPEAAKIAKLQLDLDITHSYRGDLIVTLTSPSGKSAVVSSRAGGSADDLKGTFDLSAFAGEPATGPWKLTVQDTASQDTGTLTRWGFMITPDEGNPPQPTDDSDPMTHITHLASDAMRGRNSPSPELAAAASYVEGLAKKYGLEGPNTNNPANPYLQEFDLFTLSHEANHTAAHSRDPKDWGVKTFQNGFYLEDQMSQESRDFVERRLREEAEAHGRLMPAPLNGKTRSVEELRALVEADPTKVQNVMGMLKGTGPNKDEVIVVMAHLDHVGVGRNGVNNGADDNASGSAVLLAAMPELAAAQKRGELDRSILFLWTGAEEQGLVGSQYFADHPIPGVGLENITGVVNMDMVGRWDDQRLSVIDTNSRGQSHYLKEVAEAANAQMSDPFDRMNRDINQFRERQDGAVFTRRGEDVLFVFEGLSNPRGGGELIPEYHGPADDVDKILRDNGGNKPRRVTDFLVNVLTLAANRPESATNPVQNPAVR